MPLGPAPGAHYQSWIVDRLKRRHRVAVVPDIHTPRGAPTLDAAVAWLKRRPCGRH
ncbi:MAG TPA: hypothetical protein VGB91_08805 [Rhizomicrobium sp.]